MRWIRYWHKALPAGIPTVKATNGAPESFFRIDEPTELGFLEAKYGAAQIVVGHQSTILALGIDLPCDMGVSITHAWMAHWAGRDWRSPQSMRSNWVILRGGPGVQRAESTKHAFPFGIMYEPLDGERSVNFGVWSRSPLRSIYLDPSVRDSVVSLCIEWATYGAIFDLGDAEPEDTDELQRFSLATAPAPAF